MRQWISDSEEEMVVIYCSLWVVCLLGTHYRTGALKTKAKESFVLFFFFPFQMELSVCPNPEMDITEGLKSYNNVKSPFKNILPNTQMPVRRDLMVTGKPFRAKYLLLLKICCVLLWSTKALGILRISDASVNKHLREGKHIKLVSQGIYFFYLRIRPSGNRTQK
jgi:hypothetical protein